MPARFTALTAALKAARAGSEKLDQMFWAAERGHEFPLAHYDEETWWDARRQGEPEAFMTTDLSKALTYIHERHPEARVKIEGQGGRAFASANLPTHGIGIGATYRQDLDLGALALALAAAFSEARGVSIDIDQRVLAASEAVEKAPHPKEWPVEQLEDGKWVPVNHEHRLAGNGGHTEDAARRFARDMRWVPFVVAECRTRYEEHFPAREEPDTEPNGLEP